ASPHRPLAVPARESSAGIRDLQGSRAALPWLDGRLRGPVPRRRSEPRRSEVRRGGLGLPPGGIELQGYRSRRALVDAAGGHALPRRELRGGSGGVGGVQVHLSARRALAAVDLLGRPGVRRAGRQCPRGGAVPRDTREGSAFVLRPPSLG